MNNILKHQPITNIGCLGCVSDGKSTLVEKLTNVKTQRHSSEKNGNITIKQGYANMKIWQHNNKYYTTNSTFNEYIIDDEHAILVNHISFVDCPGHQDLMLTLLSSLCLMDAVIIVISVDKQIIKKQQLIQQLMAVKLANITNIIICLNKIDLVKKSIVLNRKIELDEILLKYNIKPLFIIPTSFNKNIGLDNIVISIMNILDIYSKKINEEPLFIISRSFDVNKPGVKWNDVLGGVLGGTLIKGSLSVGDIIKVQPGTDKPLLTKIISIKSEKLNLDKIVPGGLIGIGTNLDPFYCKNDALSGNIISTSNNTLTTYTDVSIEILNNDLEIYDLWKPKINEKIILLIGTRNSPCIITDINNNLIKCKLIKSICISKDQYIIICSTTPFKILGRGNLQN